MKTTRSLFLICLSLAFISCSYPVEAPLYGVWEVTLPASGTSDPRADVSVTLTSPSGEQHTIDAFWDGEGVWKSRYMPTELGEWRWSTTSEPVVEGLSGKIGSFLCVENEGATRFDEHGPIQVSENGRFLEHADGTPFFWLGDTAWNGALKADAESWQQYLNDRVEKRFSVIQFVSTQWRAADHDAEGQVAYFDDGPVLVNPVFWQRMDQRVQAINDAGLLAAPVVLWGLGDPEKVPVPGRLPEPDAVYLAKYITARYGAHHVLWFLGGDDDYFGDLGEFWRKVGRQVFGGKTHAPVTLHPRGMQWAFDDFADEDWLDVLIYQSGHGDGDRNLEWTHSGPPSQAWKKEPKRPIINSEPNYEDHLAYNSRQPHPAYHIRRASYWSLLNAPTAGVSYGAHGIWSWETEPGVPKDHEGAGIAKPWFEAKDLEGASNLKLAVDLLGSLRWWELIPAPDMLRDQPGAGNPAAFVSASKTKDGSQAILYLPMGGVVELQNLDGLQTIIWFNPRTGEETPVTGDEGRFTAPDGQDWILVFK